MLQSLALLVLLEYIRESFFQISRKSQNAYRNNILCF